MTQQAQQLAELRRQVMWNRLLAVVEEQARTLVRTSFSTPVREAGDLSAGVFDTQGRMLAQAATGTPGHVNTMAMSVRRFLTEYPIEVMKPGDVFVTNDPWLASGHLHDVTVVSPAFYKGRAIALFAAVAHLVDVGGRGMGPDGREIYEEGLQIPIMPLMRAGAVNEDLIRIVRTNSREPVQVEGDLHALIAAGNEGKQKLISMLEEYGLDDLDDLGEHILMRSREATLQAISKLLPGKYSNSMTIDGYGEPVTLAATCTISKNRVEVSWEGTSAMSRYGINVVEPFTAAYTCFGLRCLIAPDIPNNDGSLGPFVVTAPPGSILHAVRPAPVSARHIIGLMLPDVVLGCLEQAMERGVPAETGGMWNPYLRGNRWPDGSTRSWETFFFSNGGMGARPSKDGLSATAFPAGTKSVQVEVAEAVAPIVVWRKELRPDSGGAGKTRGGLGQVITIGSAGEWPLGVQAMFERMQHPARGRSGGVDGAAGRTTLRSGSVLRGMGLQEVPSGDALHLELPGGGGYGSPFDRPIEMVIDDLEAGVISEQAALDHYGVVYDHSAERYVAADVRRHGKEARDV